MKLKHIYFIALSGILFLPACKKDFINLTPYDQIPFAQAITNENDMQAAVNGIYSNMRSSNLYGRTLPLVGDLMADNAYISVQNSNRYLPEYNFTEVNGNATDYSNTWISGYSAILRANQVINSSLTTTANVNQLKGEALTLRALIYFNLVNYYARPYTQDPNNAGIPIVLTYNPSAKPARAKVSEVYAQIEKDLNDAFGLMTNISKNSSYVTKYVARALLSRVELFKGNWDAAKTAALDVVTNGGYTLVPAANLVAYWKNPAPISTKVETIFEISADNVNNNGTNALAYFYDQSGYGDALASDDLYNQYSTTDARRNLFITGTRANQTVRIANKYPNTTNTSDKDDSKVIRYSEVILTLAEAYYRLGDEANATLYLNMLVKQRDPSFAGYSDSGPALLEDIILERRKELAFEGMRYLDLQRLNRDVVRVNINNNYNGITPLMIPFTNPKRIWPIPVEEQNSNPNVTQNPGY